MKVLLEKDAIMPTRSHPDDAGLDLYCRERKNLWAGQSVVFDTGVHIEIPRGFCGVIMSRSGLNIKHGIVAAGNGVIDSGYSGSIKVKLYHQGTEMHRFEKGDRIAQLLILPYAALYGLEQVDELWDSDRGENGIGSTGR